jgi:hypothetical protein
LKELPIACSLEAGGLAARLAEAALLGGEALLSSERRGARFVLRFRAVPGIRRRLEALIAAEAECCPFLELELARDGRSLVLAVSAPPGGEGLAEGLAGAFTPGGDAQGGATLVSGEGDRAFATHEPQRTTQTEQERHG